MRLDIRWDDTGYASRATTEPCVRLYLPQSGSLCFSRNYCPMMVERRVSCREQNGTETVEVPDRSCYRTRNWSDCKNTVWVGATARQRRRASSPRVQDSLLVACHQLQNAFSIFLSFLTSSGLIIRYDS